METCPRCGCLLNFHLEYNYGYPTVFYTCLCGYDSRGYKTTVCSGSTTDFRVSGNPNILLDRVDAYSNKL